MVASAVSKPQAQRFKVIEYASRAIKRIN